LWLADAVGPETIASVVPLRRAGRDGGGRRSGLAAHAAAAGELAVTLLRLGCIVLAVGGGLAGRVDEPSTLPAAGEPSPAAPDTLLVYYCFDANGPRDWTPERLKHCLGDYRARGTPDERANDVLFDTYLWMYRKSSRGHLFETSANATPTTRVDWEECLDRLFAPGKQLHALEAAAEELGAKLGRPVRPWVILTLPYPDVRVAAWNEAGAEPQFDFRTSDEPRLAAVRWYADAALARWQGAGFKRLRLLGFYWFNEGHRNLRAAEATVNAELLTDLSLIRQVAAHVHTLRSDGRRLTLSWIPYSPYGGERIGVIRELMQAPAAERIDYLMIQPNYFFARWKKERPELVSIVRNAASVGAGVEVEFDEALVKDEAARQRLRDYLDVIPAEHPSWRTVPIGYYQGLRSVERMATTPELAPLYEALYDFVRRHRAADNASN